MTTIYSSKKKSILLLAGSLVFVGLGVFFIIDADKINHTPFYIELIGLCSVLFFGFCAVTAVMTLIKRRPQLIQDENGITMFFMMSKPLFIPWQEIETFSEVKIHNQKIINIHVANPNNWIAGETRTIRKRLMEFNLKNYDTPFNLSASVMEISHPDLLKQLQQGLKDHRMKRAQP